jgi:hypothetical protein
MTITKHSLIEPTSSDLRPPTRFIFYHPILKAVIPLPGAASDNNSERLVLLKSTVQNADSLPQPVRDVVAAAGASWVDYPLQMTYETTPLGMCAAFCVQSVVAAIVRLLTTANVCLFVEMNKCHR